MIAISKILIESLNQAFGSLAANKLRTFLSLLGIMIGIFCIIAVLSAVNSLEDNVQEGFSELGTDVVYIERMPWSNQDDLPWWKYLSWPKPDFRDYEVIKEKIKLADRVSYSVFKGRNTIKYRSAYLEDITVLGSTPEYIEFSSSELDKGRFFSPFEYDKSRNVLILGHKIATDLFGNKEALNQEVKLLGQKYTVIGVLKAEGDNMFNFMNFDELVWTSYSSLKKYMNTREDSYGRMLAVRKSPDIEMDDAKAEITGILRAHRKLRPKEESNFFINELSMLTKILEDVFGVLNIAGFLIGIFALIVGMFSVANIMFVSVKERTNQIGIKKALGAKRYFIMLEFLMEAIILCLIGGLIGIGLVFLLFKAVTIFLDFPLHLSVTNLLIGISTSVLVGVISGIIPAALASGLDPVIAIRS